MSRNLTGSKRIIYDSCVALYNAIQKWRSLTAESHSIILSIWTEKQEKKNETKEESVIEFSPETFKKLEKLISSLIIKVQNLMDFSSKASQMEEHGKNQIILIEGSIQFTVQFFTRRKSPPQEITVEKLKSSAAKIKAVCELSDLHQSNTSDFSVVADYIPFKTWSLSKFNIATEEIISMFENEFKVKSSIRKEICHILHKSTFIFFEACWKYEPNIDKHKLDNLLNSILFELDLILEIN